MNFTLDVRSPSVLPSVGFKVNENTLILSKKNRTEKTRAKYGFKFQSCLLCQQQLYKKKNKQKDLALLQKITTKNGSTKKITLYFGVSKEIAIKR